MRESGRVSDGSSVYTYGEGDLASRRLELVAEVMERSSRSFLAEAVSFRPHLALDLGSGLGHTTRLIAEVLGSRRVVGIEHSEGFLSKARSGTLEGVSFIGGDVTQIPLLHGGEADLIHARLLLAHLPQPETIVEDWLAQLVPGGLLLLQEVERIETEHRVFRDYLEILEQMMVHYGQELYIGPRLDVFTEGPRRRMSRVTPVHPTTGQAAGMFSMNLANWRENEFVKNHHSKEKIDRLANELSDLLLSQAREEIRWGLRQIVLSKLPTD
jgi:ubiquinone/menaquinone biosynthesis C-methylase UbiE